MLISIFVALTAYSAEITSVTVTDPFNSIVTLKADFSDGQQGDNVMIIIAEKTLTTPAPGQTFYGNNTYIAQAEVNEDKKCEISFKFTADSGEYKVYITDLTKNGKAEDISNAYGIFKFYKYDDILSYVEKLGKREYAQSDIYELLCDIGPSMGIDLSLYANNTEKQSYLEKNMYDLSQRLTDKSVAGVIEISELTNARYTIYTQIKNTILSSGVSGIISGNYLKAELDMTEFNNLSPVQKEKVYSSLTGKTYTSYELFKTDFELAITNAKKPQNTVAGGGGGGGGGAVAVMPSVSVDINETSQEIVKTYTFSDLIDAEWAREAVEYLAANNIINGVSENKFAPNDSVTREQFVKMLVLTFGMYDANAICEFKDTSENDWHYKFIASAKNCGIVNGISAENFGVNQQITRQDMCVMIYRAAKAKGVEFTTEKKEFADFESIDEYAKESVSFMSGEGIINGMGNNMFAPYDVATRAQAAKILHLFLKED